MEGWVNHSYQMLGSNVRLGLFSYYFVVYIMIIPIIIIGRDPPVLCLFCLMIRKLLTQQEQFVVVRETLGKQNCL